MRLPYCRRFYVYSQTSHISLFLRRDMIPISEPDTAYRFTLKRHSLLFLCLLLFILANIGPLDDHSGAHYAVPYRDLL